MAYKLKGPTYDAAAGIPAAPSGKLRGPVYDPPKDPNAGGSPMKFLADIMRNFNDTMSFGLYDKGLEATGIDKEASQKTRDSDKIAAILGKTGGGIVPGMGMSAALEKAIPSLAKTTLPMIAANSAASSGAVSGVDQMVRHGNIDPLQLMLDTALGGATGTGVGAMSRVLSPGARVRARGNDLTPKDKQAMGDFMTTAGDKGIRLDVPEAAKAIAPGRSGDIEALHNNALASPKGSQVGYAFDEARKPGLAQAGKDLVSSLPRVSPFEAQQAATQALSSVKTGFRQTAEPLFRAAGPKKVAPTWVKSATKEPYIKEAIKSVSKDKGVVKRMSDEIGDIPQANHIAFLSQVVQKLSGKAARQAKNNEGTSAAIARDNADQVQALIDRVAPGQKQGSDIIDQGRAAVDELKAGPLGKIAQSADSGTQGNALFGALDQPSASAAADAMGHLPSDVPGGVLANRIEGATQRDPLTFGQKALPTEHSMTLAAKAAGPDKAANMLETINAAKAVTPKGAHPESGGGHMGWTGPIVSALFNYGKGGVAKLLQDPKSVKKLGDLGILQEVIQALGTSGVRTANEMRERGN